MRKSRVIEEWRDEGREEGRLEARRADLLLLLKKRFTDLPTELVHRIEAEGDPKKLDDCLSQIFDIKSPDELKL